VAVSQGMITRMGSSVVSRPISRHHHTQQTRTNCRFVHLPPEDELNVSPKHVKLRHYNAINLFVLYVGYYTSNFIK
jgi:hypothetical protein